jgi:threonyl-tRNA synthetase
LAPLTAAAVLGMAQKRSKLKEYQYQEVKGPFMMDRVLWEKTGHWENYKDAMFTT